MAARRQLPEAHALGNPPLAFIVAAPADGRAVRPQATGVILADRQLREGHVFRHGDDGGWRGGGAGDAGGQQEHRGQREDAPQRSNRGHGPDGTRAARQRLQCRSRTRTEALP